MSCLPYHIDTVRSWLHGKQKWWKHFLLRIL